MTVTFDATGQEPGICTASLLIDPNEPQMTVPVELVVEPCGDTMHVRAIGVRHRDLGNSRYVLTARVRITDGEKAPVPGATVDIEWTLPEAPSS